MNKEEDSNISLSGSSSSSWDFDKWFQSTVYGFVGGFMLDMIYRPGGPKGKALFTGMFTGLGFMYGGLETTIYGLRGTSVDDVDVFNSSLAGFGTGALYKCKSGPKQAAVAAALGGLAGSGFATLIKKQNENLYARRIMENSNDTHTVLMRCNFMGFEWLHHRTYYFSFGIYAGAALDVIKIAAGRTTSARVLAGYNHAMPVGCVGFIYGALEKGIYTLRGTDIRVDDVFNSSLAGLGTGAIYKLRSGPKPAAIAAAIGGLAAAGIVSYNNPKQTRIS